MEFCYQWSNQNCGNQAILRIKKNSPSSIEILEKCILLNTCVPMKIFKNDDSLKKLYMLPCSLFDPVWLIDDEKSICNAIPINNFDDFFKIYPNSITYKEFCKGAFTFHWHNRWNLEIEQHSIFEQLDIEFNIKNL